MKVTRLIIILLAILILSISVSAENTNLTEDCQDNEIHFFYSATCPHCKNEMKFLKDLEEEFPQIKIHYLEAAVNYEEFQAFADAYNTTTSGVPRTFIGDKAFVAFSKESGELEYHQGYKAYIGYENQLRSAILDYFNIQDTSTPADISNNLNFLYILIIIPIYLLTYPFLRNKFKHKRSLKRYWISGLIAIIIIIFFIIIALLPEASIKDFASSLPFPVFVFIIALADGFNPCAFTVLIILLSLLTYSQDKRSMIILGLTFIITSAVMYFIFIMVMIFAANWAIQRYGTIIMSILGIVILFAGLINLKDFLFFKRGISLSISDRNKSRFTHKASSITRMIKESKSLKTFVFALGATILLAVFVNLIELGCTAILPAIYMVSLLNSVGTNILLQLLWTLFYSVIYIVPLLAILFNFIYTFKSTRLTEKQGRILKLISGLFMLLFGILMIFYPELLMFS